jgi:hypothetical protein
LPTSSRRERLFSKMFFRCSWTVWEGRGHPLFRDYGSERVRRAVLKCAGRLGSRATTIPRAASTISLGMLSIRSDGFVQLGEQIGERLTPVLELVGIY